MTPLFFSLYDLRIDVDDIHLIIGAKKKRTLSHLDAKLAIGEKAKYVYLYLFENLGKIRRHRCAVREIRFFKCNEG
jgi:hypothetical protein